MARSFTPQAITNALVALRTELISDSGPGLNHVEVLLELRREEPSLVRRKSVVRFCRGKLRLAIMSALREGPLTGPDIVAHVAQSNGLTYKEVYNSVYAQLSTMKRAGLVGLERTLWRLCATRSMGITGERT